MNTNFYYEVNKEGTKKYMHLDIEISERDLDHLDLYKNLCKKHVAKVHEIEVDNVKLISENEFEQRKCV